MWNHTWKLALTVAVAVGGYFGFAPGSDDTQTPEALKISSPNSTTGIDGDINIYPPQVPSNQQDSLDNNLTSQETSGDNNTFIRGDGNINGDDNTVIKGNDNDVDNSSETNYIEEQNNDERQINTEQLNENNAPGAVNCNNNNDSCVENQTINNN